MAKADVMAGRAYVSLYTKNDKLTRGLNAAKASINQLGSDLMGIGAKMAAAGGAMLTPLALAVSLASDFEESFSKFSIVFGEASAGVKKWSDDFANAVGRSKLQIVQFMASTQDLFVPIGFDPKAAEQMSKQLTTLAVDLASFNNMADDDALRDLHAALTGSGEVMKKYGVLVSEAAVKQELLNQAIDPRTATEMEKVQARLNIIMRGTTAAHGDAIRTAGSFANQMKALKSTFVDMGVEIGTALLPSLSRIAASFREITTKLISVAKANPDVVASFAAVSVGVIAAGAALYGLGIAAKVASAGIGIAVAGVTAIKTASKLAIGAFNLFVAATTGVASVLQGIFATSLLVTAGATGTLAATQTAASVVVTTYAGLLGAAASSTALLGITSGLTASALIAQSGAMITASAAGSGMILASSGASAGMLSLSGSSVVAAAGLGTFTAAGGVMATAWTGIAGVMSAAWAVIMGPITPFVIAAGAIVAAVTAIGAAAAWSAIKGTDFSAAWTLAKNTLSELMQVAKQVGGILMDALAGGDYDLAFRAVMAGLKIALAEGIEGMRSLWKMFWGGMWGMTIKFWKSFIGIILDVVTATAKAIANPLKAAKNIKDTLGRIGSAVINLDVGFDTKDMKAQAQAELDAIEKEIEERKKKREAAAAAEGNAPGAGGGDPGKGDQDAVDIAKMDADIAALEAQLGAIINDAGNIDRRLQAEMDALQAEGPDYSDGDGVSYGADRQTKASLASFNLAELQGSVQQNIAQKQLNVAQKQLALQETAINMFLDGLVAVQNLGAAHP